ncbi:MAG: ATP-binding protein [Sandaracinaceae bacterium]|nr:ATP-binding protein [Sandaracinaceae bacterium]
MATCHCNERHTRRRVVLTGGPGAGKTAVLELARRAFCGHVQILPEAAGIIFGGGFPRAADPAHRQAAQRAIYFVQRELEAAFDESNAALVVCDRGTIDGGAYWPGPQDLWSAVGTTLQLEQKRYDAAIHLRTPEESNGYNFQNPLRRESAVEARLIDERIAGLWVGHPQHYVVDATQNFLDKASRVLAILHEQIPPCCRVSIGDPAVHA